MFLTKGKIQTLFFIGIVLISLSLTPREFQLLEENKSVFLVQGDNRTQNEEFFVIEDGLAYQIFTEHLVIYNVTIPAEPVVISLNEVDFGNMPANLFVKDRMVYVGDMDKNFYTIDCSDPRNVLQKATYTFEEQIHDIVVYDDNLYITHEKNLTIYDISGVEPSIIGTIECPCPLFLWYLVVHKNFAYPYEFQDDFEIINVTSPSNPIFVERWEGYWARKIAHCGDIILETDYGDGFRIVNISIPNQPKVEAYFEGVNDISFQKDVFYYNEMIFDLCEAKLYIHNASDFNNLTIITEFQPNLYKEQYFSSIYVENNHVFIFNWGDDPLYIIDITDPQNPVHVYPHKNVNFTPISITSLIFGAFGIFILITIKRKKRTSS